MTQAYFPFCMTPMASRMRRVNPYTHPNGLKEYPISTVKFFGKNIPASGGGYFRLFPYWLTKMLLTRINNMEKQPFTFYLTHGRLTLTNRALIMLAHFQNFATTTTSTKPRDEWRICYIILLSDLSHNPKNMGRNASSALWGEEMRDNGLGENRQRRPNLQYQINRRWKGLPTNWCRYGVKMGMKFGS